jgi:hypothetical protein
MNTGETVLAYCGCPRCVHGLGVNGHGRCPAALCRRSGILDAGGTEAGEPASNPAGENVPQTAANRRGLSTPSPPVSCKAPP